jgi:hypothetical protein
LCGLCIASATAKISACNPPLPNNPGTSQYWKIFYRCINPVDTKKDFAPILISGNRSHQARIQTKLDLLRRLQDAGVWLLDASLAALYVPGQKKKAGSKLIKDCLRTSWDSYVGQRVRMTRPAHIIRIGRGELSRVLDTRLSALRIAITVIPQPQEHLSAKEHFEGFGKCYNIVSSTQ